MWGATGKQAPGPGDETPEVPARRPVRRGWDRGLVVTVVLIVAAFGATWGVYDHFRRRAIAREIEQLEAAGWERREAGDPRDARRLLSDAAAMRRATGTLRTREGAFALHGLGLALEDLGADAEAELAYMEALAIRRETLAPDDPDIAWSLNNLGVVRTNMARFEEAGAAFADAVRMLRRRPAQRWQLAWTLQNLAWLERSRGRGVEAAAASGEALELTRTLQGTDSLALAKAMSFHAHSLVRRGDLGEARALAREAVGSAREAVAAAPAPAARCLVGLAWALQRAGSRDDAAEAEALFVEALGLLAGAKWSDRDIEPLHAIGYLAQAAEDRGDRAGADKRLDEALSTALALFGESHAETARAWHSVANIMSGRAEFTKALEAHERALAINRRLLGDDRPDVIHCMGEVADLRAHTGDRSGAESLLMDAVAIATRAIERASPESGAFAAEAGVALVSQDRADLAEPLFRHALEQALLRESPRERVASLRNEVAWSLALQEKNLDEGAALALAGLEGLDGATGHGAAQRAYLRDTYATILVLQGRPMEAIAQWEAANADLAAAGAEDRMHWASSMSRHGRCLMGLGRREEGEALVRSAVALMETRPIENTRELAAAREALGEAAAGAARDTGHQ